MNTKHPFSQTNLKSRTAAIATMLACALMSFSPLSALADGRYVSADLTALETHFFQRTYDQEPSSARLSRLEGLVFGMQRTGSDQDRISRLLAGIPNGSKVIETAKAQAKSLPVSTLEAPSMDRSSAAAPSATSASSAYTQTAAAPATSTYAPTPTVPVQKLETASSAKTSAAPAASGSDYYPTVTALERRILQETHTDQPVSARLAKLEATAFGSPSSVNDMSARVDLLKSYVNAMDQGTTAPASPPQTVADTSSLQDGMSRQVAELEQRTFGRTFGNDGLVNRVDRLEQTVFPQQGIQSFTPISSRLDRLAMALNETPAAPQVATNGSPQTYGAPGMVASAPSMSGPSQQQQQPQFQTAPTSRPLTAKTQLDQPTGGQPMQMQNWRLAQNQPQSPTFHKQKVKKDHPILHKFEKAAGEVGVVAAGAATMAARTGMMYGMYGMMYGGMYNGYRPYGSYGYGYNPLSMLPYMGARMLMPYGYGSMMTNPYGYGGWF